MAKEIKIPQIAEGVESATVTEVLVKEGDSIEKDQSIIAVESDKASVEIPSPEAGTVKSISVSEGDEVEVGDVILELEEGDAEEDPEEDKEEKSEKNNESEQDEDSEGQKEKSKESEEDDLEKENSEEEEKEDKNKKDKKSTSEEEDSGSSEEKEKAAGNEEDDPDDEDGEDSETKKNKKHQDNDSEDKKDSKGKKSKNDKEDDSEKDDSKDSEKDKTSSGEDVPAAPGVRRFARELGVEISEVKGSGSAGRISKEDVKAHNKGSNSRQRKTTSDLPLPDFSEWGETERKALSGIRKATAKNTAAAWSTIPHVFQFDEADISDIELRMEKLQEKADGNLTITAILAKISASALRQFPKFNASIDMENEEMILKKYVNIGIAVDTEKGLLVPVIRNADQKTIIEISTEITELAEKARNGKLSAEEMKGGNFTISNLGGIGGTNFTPIVYHPQVAILGVSRAKKQPVYKDDDTFEARDILPLSLSYDHRIIDGAEGVRFLHWISRALEDPYEALLGA